MTDLRDAIYGAPDGSARSACVLRHRGRDPRKLHGDGSPDFVLHPSASENGVRLVDQTGARILVASRKQIRTLFDFATARVTASFPIELGMTVSPLRAATTCGPRATTAKVRHYHGGVLVASVPVHATSVQGNSSCRAI